MIDVGVEVRVQLLPTWPYVAQPQQQLRVTDTWQSPAPFIFFAARDTAAAAFWIDRDRAMPAMWEDAAECDRVRLPPHALLRLQPAGMPGQLAPCPLGPWVRRLLPLSAAQGVSSGGEGVPGWGEGGAAGGVEGVEGGSGRAATGAADGGSEDGGSGRDFSAVQFNEDIEAIDEVSKRMGGWRGGGRGQVG